MRVRCTHTGNNDNVLVLEIYRIVWANGLDRDGEMRTNWCLKILEESQWKCSIIEFIKNWNSRCRCAKTITATIQKCIRDEYSKQDYINVANYKETLEIRSELENRLKNINSSSIWSWLQKDSKSYQTQITILRTIIGKNHILRWTYEIFPFYYRQRKHRWYLLRLKKSVSKTAVEINTIK